MKKTNKKNEEWIKPICKNDHIWGNGKDFDLEEKCPECGGNIVGFKQRKLITIDEARIKGLIFSKGTWENDKNL